MHRGPREEHAPPRVLQRASRGQVKSGSILMEGPHHDGGFHLEAVMTDSGNGLEKIRRRVGVVHSGADIGSKADGGSTRLAVDAPGFN